MSTRIRILLAVLVVAVVVVGGAIYWFLRDDSPDEVSLEAATATVETTVAGTADAGPSAIVEGDISGTWTVDTETGEFDYESATGTFAGFRIEEELANIGSTTAVGRTGDVSGSITIDGTTVTDGSFEVDMTTITTNESRRDGQVQKALETGQFPTGTFTLTQPVELEEGAAEGAATSVQAAGQLTLHGVTRDITMAIDAQLVESTVVVVGTTDITFSDYGVAVPTSPAVLSVEDHGTLELQLLLARS